MTLNKIAKLHAKIIAGKNKYYPKDLIEHLKHAVPDCDNCKRVVAEQAAININIVSNGGRYDKTRYHRG